MPGPRRISLCLIALAGCDPALEPGTPAELCSAAWMQQIDVLVTTGDGHGHGPDIGSDEWRSVVEFKLGIRDEPDLPGRHSRRWCELIDRLAHAGG